MFPLGGTQNEHNCSSLFLCAVFLTIFFIEHAELFPCSKRKDKQAHQEAVEYITVKDQILNRPLLRCVTCDYFCMILFFSEYCKAIESRVS